RTERWAAATDTTSNRKTSSAAVRKFGARLLTSCTFTYRQRSLAWCAGDRRPRARLQPPRDRVLTRAEVLDGCRQRHIGSQLVCWVPRRVGPGEGLERDGEGQGAAGNLEPQDVTVRARRATRRLAHEERQAVVVQQRRQVAGGAERAGADCDDQLTAEHVCRVGGRWDRAPPVPEQASQPLSQLGYRPEPAQRLPRGARHVAVSGHLARRQIGEDGLVDGGLAATVAAQVDHHRLQARL